MQDATQKLTVSQREVAAVQGVLAQQEAAVKAIALALAEKGQAGGKGGSALPTLPDNPTSLTVADLQARPFFFFTARVKRCALGFFPLFRCNRVLNVVT